MKRAQAGYEELLHELDLRKRRVSDFLRAGRYEEHFRPEHVREAVLSYIWAGGKSLRPAVLLLACSAVGGNEDHGLPAAAAIEVYHTWTLVHDDIIDRDSMRRGLPTVHAQFAQRAKEELGLQGTEAEHYGTSLAILTGDAQQAWSVALMCELAKNGFTAPETLISILQMLYWDVQNTLIEGETLDIQYSNRSFESLDDAVIADMLWKKTGVLYRFAGAAGAMIGLNVPSNDHPLVKAISEFASRCGTAFQLQDDILGVVGDESQLGKPVGSDFREGKRTTIVFYALKRASAKQKAHLLSILGNKSASQSDVVEAIHLLQTLGGIEETHALARSYVTSALHQLKVLPWTRSRDLLEQWAYYLVDRKL
ncbi:MAG: polyprenyl synthetase family protein [Anaerolineales bacterium]|nr:polyprenyl synthetase family protein [Anaerolineales bacterium]